MKNNILSKISKLTLVLTVLVSSLSYAQLDTTIEAEDTASDTALFGKTV